ncbi:MAG: hypothetical protein MUF49_30605 [Oculatellaceae cyanobacterium Prado106]|jgi:hypothetical protein|nr:hypothetical protein [Oculatellaceae cyanobacterium Prado106]
MSEANVPFNAQDQSDSMDVYLSGWEDPFTGIQEGQETQVTQADAIDPQVHPNSLQAQGSTPQHAIDPITAHLSAEFDGIVARSEEALSQNQPPDLQDLISLIQELNQCNSALLDRVSQLEEALEQNHLSLVASAAVHYADEPLPQDLSAAQEQIKTLYNQLEFAHQTNQRQQILVETLTDQLEISQERVAQLERETALLQQRYTEQTQLLHQAEGNGRDLQSRLYRQQRYTLQFKAALEKCLEVPAPQYDATPDVATAQIAADYLFLPKAQRIKPWSAPGKQAIAPLPWMNFAAEVLQQGHDDSQQFPEENLDNLTAVDCPRSTTRLNLPSFALPDIQTPDVPAPQPTVLAPEEPIIEVLQRVAINQDLPSELPNAPEQAHQELVDLIHSLNTPATLEQSDAEMPQIATTAPVTQIHEILNEPEPSELSSVDPELVAAMASDPALKQQIDEVVQPLAEMLARSIFAEGTQPVEMGVGDGAIAPSPNEPQITPVQELVSEPVAPASEPPLDLPMADDEDALWQDLARLIDVSTEDMVKASLSGDFDAFEAIDFNALQEANPHLPDAMTAPDPWATTEELPQPPAPAAEKAPIQSPKIQSVETQPIEVEPVAPPVTPIASVIAAAAPKGSAAKATTPKSKPIAPLLSNPPAAQPQAQNPQPQRAATPPFIHHSGNSPSPIVYPLRPPKKRQSLAMVELPTFRKPETNPLPT